MIGNVSAGIENMRGYKGKKYKTIQFGHVKICGALVCPESGLVSS